MWTYSQHTGRMCRQDGTLLAIGYAGAGRGRNQPDLQDVVMVGPLPRGLYHIGERNNLTHLGPCALPLKPAPGNEMHGRSDFWIHADAPAHPGAASNGCIVLPSFARELISISKDRELEVVK